MIIKPQLTYIYLKVFFFFLAGAIIKSEQQKVTRQLIDRQLTDRQLIDKNHRKKKKKKNLQQSTFSSQIEDYIYF